MEKSSKPSRTPKDPMISGLTAKIFVQPTMLFENGFSNTSIANEHHARHNLKVNLNWEKLCEIASDEVEAMLATLPEPLRERTRQLPVTLERVPNGGLQVYGIQPDTLGLFTGPEFAEEGNVPMPLQIILFLENLWDLAEGDEKVFRKEVQKTFLHELGHYLGLDEDELTERGLE